MKSVIAIAMFLGAVSAQAEVKPFGSFVPDLCTVQEKGKPTIEASVVAVKDVCVGELSGMNKKAIQIQLNDGSKRTYVVTMKGPPGGMGVTTATFKGQDTDSGTDRISGSLTTTSGITVTYGINLKTTTNLTYKGSLWMVFVTQ